MLAQQQQLNLIAHARYFVTLVEINDRQLLTIIDFNAIDNFITKALVERKEYFTQKKFDAYNLIIVDKNLLFARNKKVNKETKLLSIAI